MKELEQQIASYEGQIAGLERSAISAAIEVEGLEVERKKLIVPARAGNNKAAQDRLALIDQEIATARRGIADDEAAIAEIAKELQPLRAQLAEAAKDAKREELREVAIMAYRRAQKNSSLAQQLIAGVEESIKDMALLGPSLGEFGLSLSHWPGQAQLRSLLAHMEGAHAADRSTSVSAMLEKVANSFGNVQANL